MAAPLRAREALYGVIAARGEDALLPLLALAGDLLGVLYAAELRQTPKAQREEGVTPVVDDDDTVSILGKSPALEKALEQARLVAATDSSVLVLGESGTGKELMAAFIHAHSRRADAPLVKTNCATVPAELFESEFFGHVKGAFTGTGEKTGNPPKKGAKSPRLHSETMAGIIA